MIINSNDTNQSTNNIIDWLKFYEAKFKRINYSGKILNQSDYKKVRAERYASFESGKGKEFETGKLNLEDLRAYAIENSQLKTLSEKQEYLENIINRYI